MKLFEHLKSIPVVPADPDNTPLRFGKHKGKTPEEVARVDPGWIAWAYGKIKNPPFSKTLALACEDEARDSDREHFAMYEDDDDYLTFHD